jgi:hypothetical protein
VARFVGGLLSCERLYIKIQKKVTRVWPQFDVVDFVFDFAIDPHVDGVLGEELENQG